MILNEKIKNDMTWKNNYTLFIGGSTTNAGGVGQNAISYVQNLLDLKDRYDDFLAKSFNNDKYFKQVM